MLLDVASLFEMHPPFMHMHLVASLCALGSGGTTSIQTGSHPIVLKPISVIHSLDEFSIFLKALSALVFKVPGRYSAASAI